MARQKRHGRLFVRNGVWYMRWRCGRRECTRSTGLRVSEDGSREKAEAMLEEATEVLRLRDKASRLTVVKRMLETVEEEIRDRLSGMKRDARLCDLPRLFRESSYRIDCSEEQLGTYCRYAETLVETLGADVRIADVDHRLAGRFAKEVAEGRSPNTYNKYVGGLALVWRAVMPTVGVEANPWEFIPRKKLDTNVRRALTEKEIERVFATAQGETRRLFAIGLYTGLRMGDAVRLRWGDIRNGVVYVTTAKTGAKVAIPVHPRLAEALGADSGDGGPVCPSLLAAYTRHGKSAVTGRFRRLFAKCGIETSVKVAGGKARPSCGFHSLRHTFVSMCAAAGIDRSIVQALVGHSSARMTERYTHISDGAFLSAFSAMK